MTLPRPRTQGTTPRHGAPAAVLAAERLLPHRDNPALESLASLAARLLGCASGQVSLLLGDSHFVAAATGIAAGTASSSGPLADSLCTVTAAGRVALVVEDAGSDDRVRRLPPVTSGAVGSYLGVPLAPPDGPAVGALCVFDPEPRHWSPSDVALLEQLAAAVLAELELSAVSSELQDSRLRWEVAIDAAGIGSFDWDLRTDRVDWDERLQTLFGYRPGEYVPHISEAFSRIHPEDRPAVDAAIATARAASGHFRAEYRVVLPEGGQRWVAARGRALPGPRGEPGRLLGSAYDVTAARDARDAAARVLATMTTGFLSVDREWRVTYLNATGERVVGMGAEELVGRDLWQAFPGLDESEFGPRYRAAMDDGRQAEFAAYYDHLGGWFEVRVVPAPEGLHLYFLDITARHADQERAEAATARLELLAHVSTELAATLEAEPAVARLGQLVVPALGDWCIITLVDDEGLGDIGWWHADPEQRPLVERYAATRLAALTDRSFLTRALESGTPVVVPEGASDAVSALLAPGEAHDLFLRLAPESAAVLPLRARGRTVGLLTLFRGAARPRLTDADLAVAREVAARAGLALDNARLYAQQRGLAEALQRSLLTEPPQPDHCEIAVRYAPAAEVASVGGDWFDAFLQADGATTLVIGDVVGHDTEAAAAMGQVRSLLRGIAWHSGAGPAEVLSGLDAAMEGLQVGTFATCVVARLEQTRAELERGVSRLRWSNAGHPPPLVATPDGSVALLAGRQADLLLGIDPVTRRTESVVTLDRGSTVLLYTDGLVERRGQSLDEGLALLRDTFRELAGLPLEELCDGLLARMLPGRPEDDVALVAVRLHRQDRPRPASARANRVPDGAPEHP